jgi:predicted regulator of Ras-like GTPase activity (Roadblock/LC7/MglB family)
MDATKLKRLTSLDFTHGTLKLRCTFPSGAGMPSIRDLVSAIRRREGVDAAVVLGRDGLLIDSQSVPGMDADDLAANIPAIIAAADELGASVRRGALVTAVLEYGNGLAIVSVLNADVILVVFVHPETNVGPLLFELRRNREHIAALV